jgi:HEAT repeat protein
MADFGPFRPLRPYTEADRGLFFGRDREVGELVELLTGDRPSALLLGESGVGKTSLLRAGLVPALKSRGVQATYVDAGAIDDRVTPTSGVLIVDDAGAALVEGPGLERLFALLGRAGQARALRVLFSIDDNDLHRLELLERRVGAVGPRGSRLRIERFDEAVTGDVVERTVLGGGAYFEAGLSREIAVELAARGPVSPSELQLMAAAAVSLRLTTLHAWRRAGGADAVGWRLLAALCQRAGGHVAHALLAELAAAGPRGVVAVDDLARSAGVTAREADAVAAALVEEALAVRAPDGSGYVLGSEWLRPMARAFTGEHRGRQVRARLVLRQKIESGGLLKPSQMREVRRISGTLAPDEERVVRRSRTVWAGAAIAAAALPIVGLGAAYVSAGRTAHFDAGAAPGSSIVVRLGRAGGAMSSLPHAPAFGSVLVDSGITRAALDKPLATGAFGWSGPADDAWLRRLVEGMRPLGRAALSLVLDGDVKPLAAAYEDPPLRAAVVAALGAVGRGSPEETALLQKALGDSSEDVRRRAVRAAAALERRPGTPPGAGAALLQIALRDAAPGVRALALEEAKALPDERAAPLLAAVVAQSSDPVARRAALDALGASAARAPQAAAALARAVVGAGGGKGSDAAALVGRLLDAGGAPSDAAADALAAIALDGKAAEEARVEALRLLRRRAAPPAGLDALGAAGVSPKVQAAAMPLLLKAKPDEAPAKIAEAMRGPVALRAAAAAAIALQPKGPDTPKQLKILENDASAEVRAEAVRAMPVLGREALPLLMKTVKGAGAEMERAAVEAMAVHAQKLGAGAAMQALEGAVKAPRPSTRKAAIEALGHMAAEGRAPAAAALARLSRDKVVDVRSDCAQALGDALAGDKAPPPSVKEAGMALRALARDVDAGVRRRAAAALGRAKGAAAVPAAKALAAFVGDADAGVRAETAASLGALREAAKDAPWAQLLGDKDAGVRAAARRAAREAGATGGAELDKVLLQSFAGAAAGDRADIAATAGAVGAVATVRAALADGDASVRRAAADGAGGLGAAGATLLVPALGDADPAVRVAAVRGLVGAKAAAPLVEAARGPDLDVRVAALEALGRIGDAGGAAARAALERAAADASERARAAAARGLGGLGASASELLERLLDDPAADVREAAVVGLGAAWSALPSTELKLRLSDEKSADRRAAAALALARQAATPTGAESQKVLDELAKTGTPAVRLTAQLGRAFVGRPDELAAFLRIVRTGG